MALMKGHTVLLTTNLCFKKKKNKTQNLNMPVSSLEIVLNQWLPSELWENEQAFLFLRYNVYIPVFLSIKANPK